MKTIADPTALIANSNAPSITIEELIAHNQGQKFLVIITFMAVGLEKGNPDIIPCVYAWGYVQGEFKRKEIPCTRHAFLPYSSEHMRKLKNKPVIHKGSVNTHTLGDLFSGYFPRLEVISNNLAVYFAGDYVMGLTLFFGDSIENEASELFPKNDIKEIMAFGFPK